MTLPRLFGRTAFAAAMILIFSAAPAAVSPALAQSQQTAQLAVRIQELEEQIRLLTGQVEGLQFQLTQMQALVERMNQDNEFRFQQLEGNAGITSPAPSSSQGAVTSDRLPRDMDALADELSGS